MKIEKNIAVTALAYGGAGIGRLPDGRVCFIPGTIPGEVVDIQIHREKKNFVTAGIKSINQSSCRRIVPECKHAGICPGCAYMHMDYAEEIKWKQQQLQDFILRAKIAEKNVFAPPFASPEPLYYRNKLTLHADKNGQFGYYGQDNSTILPVDHCPLARKEINELISQAEGEKALFRFTENNGANLITRDFGELEENIPGAGKFLVDANGFFQVNIPAAAQLVKEVLNAFPTDRCKELLELYCGVGIFSIALARKMNFLHCTGIELNPRAIEFARRNAAIHGVSDRCRFHAGEAGKFLSRRCRKSDLTVLLDPPRSGVEKNTLKKIIDIGALKIIYVSCGPDTLIRDLKEITAAGYRLTYARLLDMFPRTAHFETIAVLEK